MEDTRTGLRSTLYFWQTVTSAGSSGGWSSRALRPRSFEGATATSLAPVNLHPLMSRSRNALIFTPCLVPPALSSERFHTPGSCPPSPPPPPARHFRHTRYFPLLTKRAAPSLTSSLFSCHSALLFLSCASPSPSLAPFHLFACGLSHPRDVSPFDPSRVESFLDAVSRRPKDGYGSCLCER